MNPYQLLCSAYGKATDSAAKTPPPPTLSPDQYISRTWVESLAKAFREHYADDPHVAVFSKYCDSNRKHFRLNELLYDVAVCRWQETTAVNGTPLRFIERSIWQVESELARDSRAAVIDFSKLVMGAADHKLFVGPSVPDFLPMLRAPASRCTGNVHVALMPDLHEWSPNRPPPRLYRFQQGDWQPVN